MLSSFLCLNVVTQILESECHFRLLSYLPIASSASPCLCTFPLLPSKLLFDKSTPDLKYLSRAAFQPPEDVTCIYDLIGVLEALKLGDVLLGKVSLTRVVL